MSTYSSVFPDKLSRPIGVTTSAPTMIDAVDPRRVGRGNRRSNELHLGQRVTTRRTIMRKRVISSAAMLLAIAAGPAQALTKEELVAKIQAAGYSEVSDIKSTAEGMVVRAVKDGKQVRLVVDSSGQIKPQK
ncbi:PepSY domain-containing protein [Bradyrhizobium sp. ISRA442]|uniref:PepSY domain-containing protein n=1 Tax=unclassified Bradyrhizobium TaxID=2631580 RepID=UPI00311B0766